MSDRFERFIQMAKEEFGLTVSRTLSKEHSTFYALFGISTEVLEQYDLPYTNSDGGSDYYSNDSKNENLFFANLPVENFNSDEQGCLAA